MAKNCPKSMLDRCETLMLDMDGTLLDLAFDNYMWLHHVPERFAAENGMDPEEARRRLYAKFRELHGRLEWYCLDHWSDHLGLDILGLHREENHRIDYLPGAEGFLETVRGYGVRVLMVTNSHLGTLTVKDEVTGITRHFDGVYASHTFGFPKERQEFWHALQDAEDFDPETTLFVDDNARVLDSARRYGLEMLVTITRPDTSAPKREGSDYAGVEGVSELLA